MGTEMLTKDYLTLLKDDIPKGRDDLIATSRRLEEVADHCLTSYDRSLDQTISYTAQALGSVAYKINLLATSFLEVLDQQNLKLNTLQTKVNHLNMQVQIHQEKTARLSIGKYTLPRDSNAMRPSRNVEPIKDIPARYKRREIDFTVLDHIGHGVKEEAYLNLGRRNTEPQLGNEQGLYSNSSRRSSTSGSETHASNFGYTNSLGPRGGSEFVGRYAGNRQNPTLSRTGGLALSSGGSQVGSSVSSGIYRAPNHLRQQVVPGPGVPGPGMMPPPPPPNIVSPQHKAQQPQYGYTGGMAVPPPPQQSTPPLPPPAQQAPIGVNQLPPPPQPMMSQQYHPASPPPSASYSSSELPPPPSSSQQYTYRTPAAQQQQIVQENNSHYYQQQQQQQQPRYVQQQSVESTQVDISHLQPTPKDVRRSKQPVDHPWAPEYYIAKVITLYAYQQNKDDELSFLENEVIYVIKKNSDGWWEGVMQNRTGLFPGNYVQAV